MTCPSCGWVGTVGCAPVERRGHTYCSAECAFADDDRRTLELDIVAPVDLDERRPLHEVASSARQNRRWGRMMFGDDLPELLEDW